MSILKKEKGEMAQEQGNAEEVLARFEELNVLESEFEDVELEISEI